MSNNPYQTPDPSTTNTFNLSPTSGDASKKVQAPAIALMIYGIVSCLFSIMNSAYAALHMAGMNPFTQGQDQDMEEIKQQAGAEAAQMMDMIQSITNASNGPVGLASAAITLIVSILTIMAASRMKNLTGYTMAMVTSALACVPCTSGCCCVGLPIGIWSIIVLVDPNVKAAFRT